MASLLQLFMDAQDERVLFKYLERFVLEVYPVRVPPSWRPFRARAEEVARLPSPALYLVATEIGPAIVDRVKRGPEKGYWRVDEVRSPVIYLERSATTEAGELISGRLWAELDVTPQTGRKDGQSDRFRRLVLEIEAHIKKTFRKSSPKGFFIGPHAARAHKEGLSLRDSAHRGGLVEPHG